MSANRAQQKNPAAVSLGRKGGKARLKTMTAKERTEAAKRAAAARWGKLAKWVERIDTEIATLSPEELARFEKFREEHKPASEFIEEILQRVRSGSMSVEEAGQWLDEAGRQREELGKRLLGAGAKAKQRKKVNE